MPTTLLLTYGISDLQHQLPYFPIQFPPSGLWGVLGVQISLPYLNQEGHYAHHINTGTPGFSDLPTALTLEQFPQQKFSLSNRKLKYCNNQVFEFATISKFKKEKFPWKLYEEIRYFRKYFSTLCVCLRQQASSSQL